jgi:hypothetical protein
MPMSANQRSEATVTRDLGPLTAREAAEARVEAALASMREAQKLIDQAAQALCSVKGMAREWRKLGALHDQARRAWYAVTGRADSLSLKGRLLLDHEPDSYEEHFAARRGR